MKFLLIGNHTCGNRGDAAILRGLIAELEAQYPQAELTVTSRYPVSSSYLLGRPVIMDLFHDWHKKLCRSFVGKIAERLLKHVIPLVLSLLADGKASWIKECLPRFFRDQIAAMAETVSAAVALERSRTAKMITTCVEQAIGQGPR